MPVSANAPEVPYDFQIVKGEDFEQELLFRYTATHLPIDIENMEFFSDCRDNINGDSILFAFTFLKDEDPLSGTVVMSVDRTITRSLIPSAGVYDVFAFHTLENRREPLMHGKITFRTASTQEPYYGEPIPL